MCKCFVQDGEDRVAQVVQDAWDSVTRRLYDENAALYYLAVETIKGNARPKFGLYFPPNAEEVYQLYCNPLHQSASDTVDR